MGMFTECHEDAYATLKDLQAERENETLKKEIQEIQKELDELKKDIAKYTKMHEVV